MGGALKSAAVAKRDDGDSASKADNVSGFDKMVNNLLLLEGMCVHGCGGHAADGGGGW